MYESGWYKIIMFGLEFLGRYYSSYRGFVIDNDDPLKLNRIKIISPIINSDDVSDGVWAFPKNNWGGKDYGFNILPLKGDMVWVEFEHGDISYPIWSFASYADNEKPSEFSSPLKYGFKTPKGNIIIIDDSDNNESILVKHKNGKEYINITKDNIQLDSKYISLGNNENEYLVLGKILIDKLNSLMSMIENHTHSSSSPGLPTSKPLDITTIANIKNSINDILSKKIKVE